MALDSRSHMDEDAIERYSMGTLSDQESDRFDEHLLICETCRAKVANTDAHVAAMRGAALRMREENGGRVLRVFPRFRRFSSVLGMLLAAGLVSLVAVMGVKPWTHVRPPSFSVDLEAMRGAGIGARVPAGRPLAVTLGLTGLPAQQSYRAEVVDRAAKVVWSGTAAAQDTKASAMFPALGSGVYFVRLYAATGELLREYGLEAGE